MRISAQAMLQDLLSCIGDRALDLICISAGAYAIDRVTKRLRTKKNDAGIRTFSVCFHVSDADYWSQPNVSNLTAELLHFLTGDLWLVSFAKHNRPQASGVQTLLALNGDWRPSRVALYSGGLDSAAGLAHQLLNGQRDILLLTAGHQSTIRRRALDQVHDLKRLVPNARTIGHASFVLNLERSGRLREQETTQRSRGFLFCTSAAVLAAACSIRNIDIYQNGHGAINLPLTAGGLSNGLSTRGAHPTFLRMMTMLTRDALSVDLQFNLPFVSMTKATMVAELAKVPGLMSWAQQSRSCVHTSWRESGVTHCGYCPACIERHQALIAAGSDDMTSYSKRLWEDTRALDDDYFRAYLGQASRWTLEASRAQEHLSQHVALSGLQQCDIAQLTDLHQRHAIEALRVYGEFLSNAGTVGIKASLREVA